MGIKNFEDVCNPLKFPWDIEEELNLALSDIKKAYQGYVDHPQQNEGLDLASFAVTIRGIATAMQEQVWLVHNFNAKPSDLCDCCNCDAMKETSRH